MNIGSCGPSSSKCGSSSSSRDYKGNGFSSRFNASTNRCEVRICIGEGCNKNNSSSGGGNFSRTYGGNDRNGGPGGGSPTGSSSADRRAAEAQAIAARKAAEEAERHATETAICQASEQFPNKYPLEAAEYAQKKATEHLLKMADEVKHARQLKDESLNHALHCKEVLIQLNNAYGNKYNDEYIAKSFYRKRDFENAKSSFENRKSNLTSAINNYKEAKNQKSIATLEVNKLRTRLSQQPKFNELHQDDVFKKIEFIPEVKQQLEVAKSKLENSIVQIKNIEANIYETSKIIKNNEGNINNLNNQLAVFEKELQEALWKTRQSPRAFQSQNRNRAHERFNKNPSVISLKAGISHNHAERDHRVSHFKALKEQLNAAIENKNRADSSLTFIKENLSREYDAKVKAEEAARLSAALNTVRIDEDPDIDTSNNDFSFLSESQQAAKNKELADCESYTCDVGTNVKWASIEASQVLAFAGGMVAGVPAGLHDTVKGILELAKQPAESYAALKDLVQTGKILSEVPRAVKKQWLSHLDKMYQAQELGGVKGFFEAGVEGGKLITDLASLGASSVAVVKTGAILAEAGFSAGKNLVTRANDLFKAQAKYTTVKLADTGMIWGHPISKQGNPFETYVGKKILPKSTQSPDNFKVYDFFDEATRVAVSVKTMNTQTASMLQKPESIFKSIKKNLNDIIDFESDKVGIFSITKHNISSRELTLGVPAKTTEPQWVQIKRGIDYARDNNIAVNIIVVE